MSINTDVLQSALVETVTKSADFSLPQWDELPDLELYMDQVITLISKYLNFFGVSDGGKPVTSSMINNYVKLGTIPPPQKKRYSRIHLAYLLVVCTLKQTLDMSTIKRLIPVGIDENAVKQLYTSFVRNQNKAFALLSDTLKRMAKPVLTDEPSGETAADLVMQIAASANIFKLLTEKITAPVDNKNTDGNK